MKNTFKKLTALAMSFALLGAGTTISKAIAPKSDNTLTASAEYVNPATCCHSTATRYNYALVPTGEVKVYYDDVEIYGYVTINGRNYPYHKWDQRKREVPVLASKCVGYTIYCPKCGQEFSTCTY